MRLGLGPITISGVLSTFEIWKNKFRSRKYLVFLFGKTGVEWWRVFPHCSFNQTSTPAGSKVGPLQPVWRWARWWPSSTPTPSHRVGLERDEKGWSEERSKSRMKPNSNFQKKIDIKTHDFCLCKIKLLKMICMIASNEKIVIKFIQFSLLQCFYVLPKKPLARVCVCDPLWALSLFVVLLAMAHRRCHTTK